MNAFYGLSPRGVDALTWLSWGLAVGPLLYAEGKHRDNTRPGKSPHIVPGGVKGFTTDVDQIVHWWTKYPFANIGARPPVWCVVLDIDPRNGGMDTYTTIMAGQEPTPTLTTMTGSGGWHLWYRLPYAGDLRGKAGEGIDIKHHGGQLVMPGSIHPTTGGLYRVYHWIPPENIPVLARHWWPLVYKPARPVVQPLPRAIMDRKRSGGARYLVRRMTTECVDGARNTTLNTVVYTAGMWGIEDDVLADIVAIARARGLEDSAITATVHSALAAAHSQAGGAA